MKRKAMAVSLVVSLALVACGGGLRGGARDSNKNGGKTAAVNEIKVLDSALAVSLAMAANKNVLVVAVGDQSQASAAVLAAHLSAPTVDQEYITERGAISEGTSALLVVPESGAQIDLGAELMNFKEVHYVSADCDQCPGRDDHSRWSELLSEEKKVSKLVDQMDLTSSNKRWLQQNRVTAERDAAIGIVDLRNTSLLALAQLAVVARSVRVGFEANVEAVIEVINSSNETIVILGDRPGGEYEFRLSSTQSGHALPAGGILIGVGDNGKRSYYVSPYGTPGTPSLGVLGEHDKQGAIDFAKKLASEYQDLDPNVNVVPTLEIIATVASAYPTEDNSYSQKRKVEDLRPIVESAGAQGVYVLLDLQPGRQSFLEQAQMYEELLKLPHVGLALDPEWRLAPHQVHLRQIGSVSAEEVNRTSEWLAALVSENQLPQKMFLLHQFNMSMLRDRHLIVADWPELFTVLQMDGQGPIGAKFGTYKTIGASMPDGMELGWKNFYDEDIPGPLSPARTFDIEPRPVFISYQ